MSDHTASHAEHHTHHTHRHKSSSSNQVLRTITFVLTPFLMALIFLGVGMICVSGPYAKYKPYINLVFNTDKKEDDTSLRSINKYRRDDAKTVSATVTEADKPQEEAHTIIYPYYGDQYGTITCEAAGMNDIPFYVGTTDDVLEMGAGWYTGSKFVGKEGNVVIAGHNHTFFRNLPNCEVGDIVTVDTNFCTLTYEVTERVVFHEKDTSYVTPKKDDRLTMYTCWNNGKLGMSEYRLAIICKCLSREWKEVPAD